MRTILNAVLHCHEMGVMHRDLKVCISTSQAIFPGSL